MIRFHMAQRQPVNTSNLPKFWRPKVVGAQLRDCQIVHRDLVSRFADGTADRESLWDWMETGFTYSQMMRLLHEDGEQFTPEAEAALVRQLDTYPAVCARYRKTGRAGLSGAELQIALNAADVMDALIAMDRHGIADRAALWSTRQMETLRRLI
ncbi:hypothetical protein LJR066_002826 [Acidovorax sp. LjRoot66]|uniref:hypothetical protein n=1 Tax=Acidovorax sp. LjRoot66 TaxID=3342334 RepID=UPI003ECD580C